MILKVLAGIIGVIGAVGLFGSWLFTLFNFFQMLMNRKEGVPIFKDAFTGPLHIIFGPELLTENGLRARRLSLRGLLACFLCFLLCGVAAMLGFLSENI